MKVLRLLMRLRLSAHSTYTSRRNQGYVRSSLAVDCDNTLTGVDATAYSGKSWWVQRVARVAVNREQAHLINGLISWRKCEPIDLCQAPRLSILVVQKLIGRLAISKTLGLGVPVEPLASGQRDIGEMGERGRTVSFLDIGVRAFPTLDAVDKVAGGLLVEVTISRLDDLTLIAGLGSWKAPLRSGTISYRLVPA